MDEVDDGQFGQYGAPQRVGQVREVRPPVTHAPTRERRVELVGANRELGAFLIGLRAVKAAGAAMHAQAAGAAATTEKPPAKKGEEAG